MKYYIVNETDSVTRDSLFRLGVSEDDISNVPTLQHLFLVPKYESYKGKVCAIINGIELSGLLDETTLLTNNLMMCYNPEQTIFLVNCECSRFRLINDDELQRLTFDLFGKDRWNITNLLNEYIYINDNEDEDEIIS